MCRCLREAGAADRSAEPRPDSACRAAAAPGAHPRSLNPRRWRPAPRPSPGSGAQQRTAATPGPRARGGLKPEQHDRLVGPMRPTRGSLRRPPRAPDRAARRIASSAKHPASSGAADGWDSRSSAQQDLELRVAERCGGDLGHWARAPVRRRGRAAPAGSAASRRAFGAAQERPSWPAAAEVRRMGDLQQLDAAAIPYSSRRRQQRAKRLLQRALRIECSPRWAAS